MAGAKVARREKDKGRQVYGQKVKYLNLSGEDRFCASTQNRLPLNGMIVVWNGEMYLNWDASEKAKNEAG